MTETAQTPPGRQVLTTGRVEAFSDGVFAIAVTLLILNIHLPDPITANDTQLRGQLLRLWPSYLAYAVSFLLIGMVWINHHRMLHHVVRVDGLFLGLNLLLLMNIAFLPFPTDVLAQTMRSGTGQHTSAVFYGLSLVVGGIFFNSVWWYAARGHRLLGPHITPHEARVLGWRWNLGPVLYLVAALIGLASAVASVCCYVALLVFYLFDMRPRTG